MLYETPVLSAGDRAVISEIHGMRQELGGFLRQTRRWQGGLRRTMQARAIRGSNTIEGYTVSQQDAVAAVDEEESLTADARTWAEIVAYRRVLTYVINQATVPCFRIDTQTLRTIHFMLLEHELVAKSAGAYRTSEIYVRDSRDDRNVYEGPSPDLVPALMEELAASLSSGGSFDAMVAGAMAHLNLVMIHPFRDGNGRMARALQTMVLARDHVVSPEFSSIEEWLGANTEDYYEVLGFTGQGAWHPERDATAWVRFCLRAHHMQAQTVRRRVGELEQIWRRLDELQQELGLPEPSLDAAFDAYLGVRVTRAGVAKRAEVDTTTATRYLKKLADAGLLVARGETRGRHYVAGPALREIRDEISAARTPIGDPYPELMTQVRAGGVSAPEGTLF